MPLTARQTGTKPTSSTPGILTGALVANTPTTIAHGMGVTPAMVYVTVNAAAAAAAVSIAWDVSSSGVANIVLVASANCTYVAVWMR